MKTLVLILCLFLMLSTSFTAAAQVDSSGISLQELKNEITFMQMNFNKSHEEFRTGMVFTVAGVLFASFGFLPSPNGNQEGREDFQKVCLAIGGAGILTGAILMIDSHKFIGKAGKWRFTGKGVIVKL